MRQRPNSRKENERKIHIRFFLLFWLSTSTIFVSLFNILRYEVILLISMINPDKFNENYNQKNLCWSKTKKSNHGLWNQDISLVGQINTEGVQEIFDGWAACHHCFTAYRTYSKTTAEQNRKNYGLRSFHAHLKECKVKQNKVINNIQSSISIASSWKTITQLSISQFTYNKNQLNDNLPVKLKDTELKFVTIHSIV